MVPNQIKSFHLKSVVELLSPTKAVRPELSFEATQTGFC